MAQAAQVQPGTGIDLNEFGTRLKSFAEMIFSRMIAARMQTARGLVAVMRQPN